MFNKYFFLIIISILFYSASYSLNSSEKISPGSLFCTWNGKKVLHGSSVKAFESASATTIGDCKSELRFCTNGNLSGTYTNTSCILGYDIIVVAGQSNAVGASSMGPFNDVYGSVTIDDKIKQLGRYGLNQNKIIPATWETNNKTYDALQHWNVSLPRQTMGFSIPFARRYISENNLAENRQVLIIPAAYGGTSILKWLGETNTPATVPQSLYDDMINRVNLALNLPGTNRVVAFLWHQGESDISMSVGTPNIMNTNKYKEKFTVLIGKIREDIKSQTVFPIIAGDYVQSWGNSAATPLITEKIQKTKKEFEKNNREVLTNDILGGVIQSSGLKANYPQLTSDVIQEVHFAATSLVALGDRYFKEWKKLSNLIDTYLFSETYSMKQGRFNWYYQYFDGNNYVDLIPGHAFWNPVATLWTKDGNEKTPLINNSWFLPGSDLDVVLTFVVPRDGLIQIEGTVSDTNINCGDGVELSIKHNSNELWNQKLDNSNTPISHNLSRDVRTGEKIHFHIDPILNPYCDTIRWNPKISYIKTNN